MGQVKSILREFVPNRKVTEVKCSSEILSCSVLQRKNGHIGYFLTGVILAGSTGRLDCYSI